MALPAPPGRTLDEAIEEALQDKEPVGDLVAGGGPGGLRQGGDGGDEARRRGHGSRARASSSPPGRSPTGRTPIAPSGAGRSSGCRPGEKGAWSIAQVPKVEAALVCARSGQRRDPRPGRRLRLQRQQVQPRDAGLAPAGLELQAVHLFGGAGKGLHARPRCSTTRRS